MKNKNKFVVLLALLAALALLASACGSDNGDSDGDAGSGDTESSGDSFRIAIVSPSAKNDVAFSQSIFDAVTRVGENRSIEVDVSDGLFVVEDAAAAIRGYAEDGYDLVIAHGSQYGAPLQEIAPEFPEVAFAWGTALDTFGLDNVSSYSVRSDEGAYVLGALAAEISESKNIGIVGPIEVGDAKLYVDGFAAGAVAQDPSVDVNINYIESFADVQLAQEAATAFVNNGADVLTGTAQMVVGATGVASAEGVPWFGTQSNQTTLGPDIVVASQVYHWEIVLEDIIAGVENGDLGGESHILTLENEGLVLEFNEDYALDPSLQELADELVEGIVSGTITTGIE